MKHETKQKMKKNFCKHHIKDQGGSSTIYALGFIGATIYYLMNATSFWIGVLGVLKAMVWPAFLVFELFQFLAL